MNNIEAKITHVSYQPLLCAKLPEISLDTLQSEIQNHSSFLLRLDVNNLVAISW